MSDQDVWFTLDELAARWKAKRDTLRRQTKLPPDDPRHIASMPIGKVGVRVSANEIRRHEERGQVTPTKTPVAKPVTQKKLLDRARQSIRQNPPQHGAPFVV